MNFKEIRLEANNKCTKKSGTLAVITLIYSLFTGFISISLNDEKITPLLAIYSVIISVASLLIVGPLQYGYSYVIRKNYTTQELEVNDLFEGFRNFAKSFVLGLLYTLYIFLWTLLFIIPGIIKSISYSMAFFISIENPELSANECIAKSKEIMHGHKWDYFCLMLSYIGWLILCILTFGILTLWVSPKMSTSAYIFYKKITNNI